MRADVDEDVGDHPSPARLRLQKGVYYFKQDGRFLWGLLFLCFIQKLGCELVLPGNIEKEKESQFFDEASRIPQIHDNGLYKIDQFLSTSLTAAEVNESR